jgi:hypothetical protein
VRVPIVQAFALVALLHVLTPFVDPTQVALDGLKQRYGETVQLEGRVAEVDPSGEVVRVLVVAEDAQARVLTRGEPPPVGTEVHVRGQPSPGRTGPVVWAEGPIETRGTELGERVSVAEALHRAPRLAGAPVAVTGTYSADEDALVAHEGRLPVEGPIEPEPGPILAWGRMSYEPGEAGYQLEATGWRPWTPPHP